MLQYVNRVVLACRNQIFHRICPMIHSLRYIQKVYITNNETINDLFRFRRWRFIYLFFICIFISSLITGHVWPSLTDNWLRLLNNKLSRSSPGIRKHAFNWIVNLFSLVFFRSAEYLKTARLSGLDKGKVNVIRAQYVWKCTDLLCYYEKRLTYFFWKQSYICW